MEKRELITVKKDLMEEKVSPKGKKVLFNLEEVSFQDPQRFRRTPRRRMAQLV